MIENRKQVLGRGLSALLDSSHDEERENVQVSSHTLPVELIVPGRHQPRVYFSQDELIALSTSIQEKGVLQPILVRVHPEEVGKFEIIAGERRWRASKKAGLEHIPAFIKDFSDSEALEAGLIENIQRQDLNPIEEAEGYRRLAEEFSHTQESLARILGKSRSHIANTLRLLTLPSRIKDYLNEGKLSAGHGRALVGIEEAEYLAEIIIEKNLNVRQTEELAKKKLSQEDLVRFPREANPEKEILKKHLSDLLEQPIDLILKGMGGKIIIPFKNPAELDHILLKFNKLTNQPMDEELR
ncbi:MAG: ParB/RepB/Spo0J family partition protein [Alphaproteobacteria bacterium]|nr:ParB/RepB/Spo0J family partition protein [Alphaproteobacteria bacterium]